MKHLLPDKSRLREEYTKDYGERKLLTRELEEFLESCVNGLPSNYTIKARVKTFDSYFKKYIRYLKEQNKHKRKSAENKTAESKPAIPMIHDTIGVRVVCPFVNDIEEAKQVIHHNFTVVEFEHKGDGYSFKEFGYESVHLLVEVPAAIGEKYKKKDGGNFIGEIAEIQIRTILQEAWAEVEHELVYKAEWTPYDMPMKRKLAAVNASLTLADTVFEEIRRYQKQLQGQLGRRHKDFFEQIEQQVDAKLFSGEKPRKAAEQRPHFSGDSRTIDDLLLNALYAHNKGLFEDAIETYSKILNMKPDGKVASIILKHRGMAYFAQALYKKAIGDFEQALKLDPDSYKSAYYSGIVRSCLKEWQGAADDFSKSLTIYPYQVFCLFRRAQVYYHLEDYPMALSDCESALDLDHEFEQGKRLKALLLEKLRM
ncbi:MAG: tetratricopeptide repeat protein [Spirochaetaceae bacterium]|jgi:putative GTP pyrophosphokinase|nr:tetratricopeptide repeat protein [Spirochaetaceae bacterium]